MNIPGKQELISVTVSGPSERIEDDRGHNFLKLEFGVFPPYGIKTANISTQIAITGASKPQPLARPELWLGTEKYIEVADAGIQKLAQALKGGTPEESAYRIYAWVQSQLHYSGYSPEFKGAAYALRYRRGDCTEYAALVVALARANGIPARLVSGYVIARDAVVKASDYHDWAELYFAGDWHLVDAQKGYWLTPAEQYIAFHIHGLESDKRPDGFKGRFLISDELNVRY